MAKRIAWLVVLAEDLRQANFARRYLEQGGHHWRTIRVCPLPEGRGAAEQHVRENYPREVSEYRSRASYESAALAVVVDADLKTVAERERELEAALKGAGEDGRKSDDAVALLIPKRHIETWVLCLLGEQVDEMTDYSRRDMQGKIKPAAQTFLGWSRQRQSVPDHCVASLRRGLEEVQRIP